MRDFRLNALKRFEKKPMLPWFADAHARPRLQRHLLLHQAHREPGRPLGGPARRDQEHLRAPRHPRGRAQVPRRRHRPVRVRGRLSPQPRGPRAPRACCSATWTPRCASTPTWCASTSARSSRPTTTSSPRSTPRSGAAARSSTCRPGVNVDQPLQAYFRINTENMGQFERTLIIADEGSPRSTTSRAARRRSTRPTRCTRRSSSSSPCPGRASPTRRSRTGRTTSTTS